MSALTPIGCYRSHGIGPPPDGGGPTIDAPDCFLVTPVSPAPIEIEFVARIQSADVAFLVDATGSMVGEIAALRATVRDPILPGLRTVVPDVRVSVAQLTDFEAEAGTSGTVFHLHASSTEDPDRIQAAVDGIWREHGGDGAEAQVVALWLTATGRGLEERLVSPVPFADCPPETTGYPCFPRYGARIAVVLTDAAFHNGPGGAYPYDERLGTIPDYEQMLAAMRSIGARAVGVYSGASGAEGERHLQALATDTRAVDRRERPIVTRIGRDGEGLADGTLDAVRTWVDEAPMDLDLLIEDPHGETESARPLVARVETAGTAPPAAAEDDGESFVGVAPGTTVRFRILLREHALGPADAGRIFRLDAVLRLDGVVRLERRTVEIVVAGGEARCRH